MVLVLVVVVVDFRFHVFVPVVALLVAGDQCSDLDTVTGSSNQHFTIPMLVVVVEIVVAEIVVVVVVIAVAVAAVAVAVAAVEMAVWVVVDAVVTMVRVA